jgi:bacteriocin biosynthesis cyclodehydratase domain-containing protein
MSQAAFLIGLLDGSRDRGQVIATAAARGIAPQVTERVLTLLAAGGALDDFPAGTLRELPAPLRARLAPELATASLAHGDGDGGARFLARRRASLVWIDGERRIARAIARILGTSGVGAIRVGNGSPADARPTTTGARRTDAVRRRPPDLTILVGRPGQELPARLVRDRAPHLAVLASEAIGVVGPLVIPGKTACLRCLDYVRAANDPSWPLILAQLTTRRAEPPACDAVLAMAVAAQAAAQTLTAIDKAPAASAAVNGTLELVLPDWRWRRRTWPVHPACTCSVTTSDSRQ